MINYIKNNNNNNQQVFQTNKLFNTLVIASEIFVIMLLHVRKKIAGAWNYDLVIFFPYGIE